MCSDQPLLSLDNQVKLALTSPQSHLVSFFESEHCDAFVFTYDTQRILTYLSGSLKLLCGFSTTERGDINFLDLLTDHPWNFTIKSENEFLLNQGDCDHSICELGQNETRVLVALRRQTLIIGTQVAGILGVGWKLQDTKIQWAEKMVSYALGISESTLMERWNKLTPAEVQVIEGIAQGQLNKTIAKNLQLSMRTVESRRSRILKKLGISSVPELVRFHLLVKQAMENKGKSTSQDS